MTKCGTFPECESCINREFDPDQCEDCDDASNYEPDEEEDMGSVPDDEEVVEEMTYDDFKSMFFEGSGYAEAA